jgi:hypothetical protein
MKFAGVVVLFVAVALVWSKFFGMPSQYQPLRASLEAAYAAAYGDAGGTTLCKYQEVGGRHWLGCRGGDAPAPGVWELIDSAGVPQCLASNGKALAALGRFPDLAVRDGIARSEEGILPKGVLSAFK